MAWFVTKEQNKQSKIKQEKKICQHFIFLIYHTLHYIGLQFLEFAPFSILVHSCMLWHKDTILPPIPVQSCQMRNEIWLWLLNHLVYVVKDIHVWAGITILSCRGDMKTPPSSPWCLAKWGSMSSYCWNRCLAIWGMKSYRDGVCSVCSEDTWMRRNYYSLVTRRHRRRPTGVFLPNEAHHSSAPCHRHHHHLH